jgi:nicotinate-nucleotide pyrophosphorylase (carboxylating)
MPLPDLNALALPELFAALTAGNALPRLLELARDEDLAGRGDVTSMSIIDVDRRGAADVVAREAGVVAGLAAVDAVLEVFDATAAFEATEEDGATCAAGARLGRLEGDLRAVLAVERTLLNLLGRLGGIATLTRRYVDAVADARAVICDTRKTTPGLRGLEKYAVRCGGGTLHRVGLHDAALYKDNHLAHLPDDALAASIRDAAARARAGGGLRFVEVEVDTLGQLRALLELDPACVDIVLLDNMETDRLAEAVALRDAHRPALQLEASGGVTLETVAAIAATGVDRISVGALTHSAMALDIGLDIRS